jgi:hypothetical protein
LSAEGGLFGLAAGRYAEGDPNLDVFLKAHPGDELRVNRVGRAPIRVHRPALTLGLTVQPEVIRDLAAKRGFRGTDFWRASSIPFPRAWLVEDKFHRRRCHGEVSAAYERLCTSLLELLERRDADGELVPVVVRLDREARATIDGFSAALEPRLGKGGDLSSVADWASKLAGGIAHIAALLHFAGGNCSPLVCTDEASPTSGYCGNSGSHQGSTGVAQVFGTSIDGSTVRSAIAIGEYLLDHALAAFTLMGADPNMDLRRAVTCVQAVAMQVLVAACTALGAGDRLRVVASIREEVDA